MICAAETVGQRMNPALPKIVELMLVSLASKEGISIEYKDDGVGGINPVVDLNDSLGLGEGLTSFLTSPLTSYES